MKKIKFVVFSCVLAVCIHNSVLENVKFDKCGRTFSRKVSSTTTPPSTTTVAAGPQIGQIVGGKDARSGDMPWIVSIQRHSQKNANQMIHFCGGTIVHPNWVLTAAHCFYKKGIPLESLTIKSGSNAIAKDTGGGTYHTIENIITHEDFAYEHYSYDIALVKVKEPFVYSKGLKFGLHSVWPICVPHGNETYLGTATVAGWGFNKSDALVAMARLQAADVNIFDCKTDTCLCHNYGLFRETHMICAGYKSGKIDACQGDSGGPLMSVQKDSNNEDLVVQIGVVSYGEGCAEENKPGVYTDLSTCMNWVKEKIKPDDVFHIP